MKLFADYKVENGYINISIWDIYNGYKAYNMNHNIKFEEYYNKFYKGRLYSTHKATKEKMSLVKKTPYGNSFFRYLSKINDKGCPETISHSTYKDIIKGMDVLNLVAYGQEIKLFVSYSDIEVAFSANGNNYFADVFVYFKKSIPVEYYYKWNGKLCFEIRHTHAVEKSKVSDCYVEGIPIFEHTISKKLLMDEKTSSEEVLLNQKKFITDILSDKIYGKILSDPTWEKYKVIEKLKKENDRLINENNELKNYNAVLMNINKSQSVRIVELENENRNVSELINYKNTIENKKLLKFLLKIFGIK